MAQKGKAYPATFAVKVKIAKEANLNWKQKAALKKDAEELLEKLAPDMVNGNGNDAISFSKTAVIVKDPGMVFDLIPKPDPQKQLPGTGEDA